MTKMKIAYINLLQTKVVGVNKKLEYLAKAIETNNLDIDVIVINNEIDQVINGVKYIKLPSKGFLDTFYRKFFRYKQFEKVVDFDKYDKIILRWSGLDLSVPNFVKKYGYKVISEHHANELVQFKENIHSMSTYVSYLLTKAMYSKFLKGVGGIIGVTPEITKSHLLKKNVPHTTISNGVNVNDISFTKYIPFDGSELKIAFIASSYSKWHGLDRFLEGLKNYAGDVLITLSIAGNFSKKDQDEIKLYEKQNIKIVFKGMCDEKQLDDILSNSNLAISTLAFFRVGIRYGCPLKSREYMARGIPFIYSYHDDDIDGQDNFSLKYPDDESAINIFEVIEFAKKVSENSMNISQNMREFSLKNLDWNKKILQSSDFVKEV